ALWILVHCGQKVLDLDWPSLQQRSTTNHAANDWDGELADTPIWDRSVMGHQAQAIRLETEDRGIERFAQTGGALRHGVEHRLKVARRARDGPENLAGRCFPVERLEDIGVLILQLGEETRVLDRDQGLVSEGLEQLDVAVREAAGLGSGDGDRPDRV